MNKHKKINKLLADFVLGDSSPREETEIRAHLSVCPQCTSELKRLEALLECVGRIRELSADNQMCEAAKQAIFATLQNQETELRPRANVRSESAWRIIMKSRITKLAGAVTIAIAGVLGIYLLSTPSPAYGIVDAPEMLREARTIHVKGWQCANVQSGLYDPDVVQPGRKETRALLEYWMDMETGCMKSTQPENVQVKEGRVTAPVYTTVYDGEFIMTINDERKEVGFSRLTPYQQLLSKRKNSLAILQSMLLSLELLDSFKKINQERINGEVFDIWQAELNAPSWGGIQLRIKNWVSPRTGYVGRVEIWRTGGAGGWYQLTQLAEIEYNVSVPGGTFTTEAPPGYTSANTKEKAYVSPLFQNRNRVGDQTITSYACFTLNDGSVILGWSCTTGWPDNDWQSDRYQEAVFKSLVAGAELPRLPFGFCTVSPVGEDPGVEYHGRHLSYTRKGGIFHEWGLYVPGRRLDKYYGRLSYNLFLRGNSKDVNETGAFTLGETGDIQIETERDFDLFVLGAMAELSDEGKPPADVTYGSVLRLAEQIRSQLK